LVSAGIVVAVVAITVNWWSRRGGI
jgi:hypothetical protein